MSNHKSKNFVLLFTTCVIGSVVIFLFALGVEIGNPLANDILELALRHKILTFILPVFGGGLLWFCMNRKS